MQTVIELLVLYEVQNVCISVYMRKRYSQRGESKQVLVLNELTCSWVDKRVW